MREVFTRFFGNIRMPPGNLPANEAQTIDPRIQTVMNMVRAGGHQWGFRFEPSKKIARLNQAEALAAHIEQAGLLSDDSYFQTLSPFEHHRALNMLTPLVEQSGDITHFIASDPHCTTITDYLTGIVKRKLLLSTTEAIHNSNHHNGQVDAEKDGDEETTIQYQNQFRDYFKSTDFMDLSISSLEAFYKHLTSIPELEFLKPQPVEESKKTTHAGSLDGLREIIANRGMLE